MLRSIASRSAVVSLVVALGLAGSASAADPIDLSGELAGAPYRIRVPAQWNGTLLLWAHGYTRAIPPEAAPFGKPFEDALLSMGYALAGSAFRNDGWAVEEGTHDSLRLARFFASTVAPPQYTIIWGASMGSGVVLASIEHHRNAYDGAVALCSMGAGGPRGWDDMLDFSLAYDVAFGWPSSWGEVGDVRDDIVFATDVLPIVLGQFASPTAFGRFEFVRLVSGRPFADFYSGANWLGTVMYFAIEGRAEVEVRAGGPVAENVGHAYSLSVPEKMYLSSLGVDADALLADMNSTTITARPNARHYVEKYVDPDGEPRGPMIMMHTTTDGLLLPEHQRAYLETAADAGFSDDVLGVYADAVGHCAFRPEQLITSVVAIDAWVRTGIRPELASFPATLGFVTDFDPGPWPQP